MALLTPPPIITDINRSNSIGRTIYWMFVANSSAARAVLENQSPTVQNVTEWQPDGPGFDDTDGSIHMLLPWGRGNNLPSVGGGAYTFYYRSIYAIGSTNYVWYLTAGANSEVHINDDDTIGYRINARVHTFNMPAGLIDDGDGHWVTCNNSHGSISGLPDNELWIDGELVDTVVADQFGVPLTGNTDIFIGRRDTGFITARGVVNGVMFHDRLLGASEIASLHADPWQVLTPQIIYAFTPQVTISDPVIVDTVLRKRFVATDVAGYPEAW